MVTEFAKFSLRMEGKNYHEQFDLKKVCENATLAFDLL